MKDVASFFFFFSFFSFFLFFFLLGSPLLLGLKPSREQVALDDQIEEIKSEIEKLKAEKVKWEE
jgi:hypothetical protein